MHTMALTRELFARDVRAMTDCPAVGGGARQGKRTLTRRALYCRQCLQRCGGRSPAGSIGDGCLTAPSPTPPPLRTEATMDQNTPPARATWHDYLAAGYLLASAVATAITTATDYLYATHVLAPAEQAERDQFRKTAGRSIESLTSNGDT